MRWSRWTIGTGLLWATCTHAALSRQRVEIRAELGPKLLRATFHRSLLNRESGLPLVNGYFSAYANRELSRCMDYWWNDAPGRADLQRRLRGLFARGGHRIDALSIYNFEADQADPDHAAVNLIVDWQPVDPHGRPRAAGERRMFHLLVTRRHGVWKFWRDVSAEERLHELLSPISDLAQRWKLVNGNSRAVTSRLVAVLSRDAFSLHNKRPEEARRQAEFALELARRLGDPLAIGDALRVHARLLAVRAEYAQALAQNERALKWIRRAPASVERGIREARVHQSQGSMNQNLDRFAAALVAYDEASRLAQRYGLPHVVALARHNQGGIEQEVGRYDRALEHLRTAQRLWRETGDLGGEGLAVIGVANLLRLKGQPQAALTKLREAFRRKLDTFGGADQYRRMKLALAEAELACDHATAARVAFDAALRTRNAPGYPRDVEADAICGLGEALRRLGQRSAALQKFDEAIRLAESIGAPDVAMRALRNRAQMLEQRRRWAEAEQAYTTAVQHLEQLRRQLRDDALRIRLMETNRFVLDGLVRCRAEQGREADAFFAAEAARARALADLLAERKLKLRSTVDSALLQMEGTLLERTAESASELRQLKSEGGPPPAVERATRQLHAHEDSLRAVQLRIQKADSNFAQLRYPTPIALSGAKALLGNDTALLAYYVLADRTLVWAVRRDRARLVNLPLGRAALHRAVRTFRAPYERIDRTHVPDPSTEEQAMPRWLYQQLVAPVRADLAGARRILLVPHDALFYLPFPALEATTGRFLGEEFAVVVTPSVTVLRDLRSRSAASPRPTPPLVLAAFAPFPSEDTLAVNRANAPVSLPDSLLEARSAARQFAPRSVVCEGPQATKTRAMAAAKRARILHFATHGRLDDVNPHYSGLRFAGVDSTLNTQDIFNLDLSAELVVLSACETAFGSRRDSERATQAEGFLGLTRGFLYAGARTVIASLWRVHDESTRRVMDDFYGGLSTSANSRDKAELLQIAQHRLRAVRPHPYYWAGLVLVGDWQ